MVEKVEFSFNKFFQNADFQDLGRENLRKINEIPTETLFPLNDRRCFKKKLIFGIKSGKIKYMEKYKIRINNWKNRRINEV